MNALQILIAFLGRVCISAIFILAAVSKFFNWAGTQQMLTTSLNDLMTLQGGSEIIRGLVERALPWAPSLLIIGVIVELLGGLLVFLGIKVRFGAFILILFLIPTTLIVHGFWSLPVEEKSINMVLFMKNMSILGGLLVVLAMGRGKAVSKSD